MDKTIRQMNEWRAIEVFGDWRAAVYVDLETWQIDHVAFDTEYEANIRAADLNQG